MKLTEGRAFLSGVGLGSSGRTERASSPCRVQPCRASSSLSRPYLCFRICLLSSMVTLSAWSLLKISKASWRPNDISSLIPVGDTRKWPQSQHQDPINFIVTLVRPQRRPWLREAHGERLLTRQAARPQAPPAGCPPGSPRSHTRCTLLAGLCLHVTVGGGVWNVWSKEMKTRVPSPQLPRTSANTLSAIIQCHISPCFPVPPHLGFLLNFILNFQAFS